MEEKSIEYKWKDCEYSHQSYYEWDTGYEEYECELTDDECNPYGCPMVCKYKVEK